MTVSIEQFLKQIYELELVPVAVLKSTIAPRKRTSRDPIKVSELLVREGALTQFQADRILAGKGERLVLGVYVIEEQLGRGGIGRVYRARHRMMQRDVAIKVLSRKILTKRSAKLRFQREMQVAAKLSHPNLVMAFDAGEHAGEPYLVMEYISGANLQQRVKQRGPLEPNQAVEVLTQVACGLEYAHGEGIIHSDIKPANLMLDAEGNVKVLDLGLARHLNLPVKTSERTIPASSAIVGTPDFMSPEQSLDFRQIDERSDIYSLGCTLFYLLTGRPLFEGESAQQKIYAHRNQPPPRLSDVREEIPPEFETIYDRMIAKDRDDRYSSAKTLREALENYTRTATETAIHFSTAETEAVESRAKKSENSAEIQRFVNWKILISSTVTVFLTLLWCDRYLMSPTRYFENSVDPTASGQELPAKSSNIQPTPPMFDFDFALELDGRSQISLPPYEFSREHVLLWELQVTPFRSDRAETQVLCSHTDSQRGWKLQIRKEFWNLSLYQDDSPVVQFNSTETIRWGELSQLSVVVHPGYAGLSVNGKLQAEWEGVADFLPPSAAILFGDSTASGGYVGKIQSIRVSKFERLLVDEFGRRVLPDSRTLVADYRFEEGEGTILNDSSPAQRHGVIEGAVWSFSD